jgi:hypothetical protein
MLTYCWWVAWICCCCCCRSSICCWMASCSTAGTHALALKGHGLDEGFWPCCGCKGSRISNRVAPRPPRAVRRQGQRPPQLRRRAKYQENKGKENGGGLLPGLANMLMSGVSSDGLRRCAMCSLRPAGP